MNGVSLIEKELTGSIIEAFFEVYNELGFGFLEQIYMAALERALLARGHRVLREVSVRVSFRRQFVGLQQWTCWSTTKSSSKVSQPRSCQESRIDKS